MSTATKAPKYLTPEDVLRDASRALDLDPSVFRGSERG